LEDLQAGSVDGFELSYGIDGLLGIPRFERPFSARSALENLAR
jgi:hypothetical protein